MRVLALDTSTDVASVALLDGGRVLAERQASVDARHGETLLPLLVELLGGTDFGPADLDLVGVGLGPGSFTGARIGVATAKGIALATGVAVRGVVSLDVIALEMSTPDLRVVVTDAYRGEVFVGIYELAAPGRLARLTGPFHGRPEEAGARVRRVVADRAWAVTGTGLVRYSSEFGRGAGEASAVEECSTPRAHILAVEAQRAFDADGPSDLASLEPLYLRDSDATLPDPPLGPAR